MIKFLMKVLVKLLQKLCNKIIKRSKLVDKTVREFNLENEQWFINWQDELNAISVK